MPPTARLALVASLLWLSPAHAQSLPLIDEVEWASFRDDCREFLAALDKFGASLPAGTTKEVQALLQEKGPSNPRLAARAVQKLLDAHCLVGVQINPQSRVKAARGPRLAELPRDRAVHVLVKVHNEGGVTHALAAASEQAVVAGEKDADRWLELAIVNEKPFAHRLSGGRVEYRLMKLVARQAGKREATLAFDVGQGTQDLGFRAEVPILFTVSPSPGRPR